MMIEEFPVFFKGLIFYSFSVSGCNYDEEFFSYEDKVLENHEGHIRQ